MNSGRIRVVLATRTLLTFTSTWRAAALALGELGCVAFFAAGLAEYAVGSAAPWYVLAAVLLGACVRAVDVEARGLFVRGGLHGLVRQGLGEAPARVAASALLTERMLLGPLAAAVAGRYVVALLGAVGIESLASGASGENTAVAVAVALLAIVWIAQRRGRMVSSLTASRAVVSGIAVLVVTMTWAALTVVRRDGVLPPLPFSAGAPTSPVGALIALGAVLFALGGVDALALVAPELEPPRIRNLQRTAGLVVIHSLAVTALVGFLIAAIVPEALRRSFFEAPGVGLVLQLAGPWWLRVLAAVAIVVAAGLTMACAARSALTGAQTVITRLVDEGLLPVALLTLHPRFGTRARMLDVTVGAQVAIVGLSGAHVAWLARAYAVGVAWSAVLKIVAVIRLRALRPEERAYRVPGRLRMFGREWPIALALVAAAIAVPAALMLTTFDAGSMVGAALVVALTTTLSVWVRRTGDRAETTRAALDDVQLLPSDEVDLRHVDARPGNLLVPVRRPHSLVHLSAALDAAGDRDVVVMTGRLVGVDVPDDPGIDARVTDDERRLFAAVTAVAERHGRAVRLLIAPGVNVFDTVVETALRLKSSEIHVGESEVLAAQDQARLLGEAWERASGRKPTGVRLFIHHPSGRTAAYYLGPHAPALDPEDVDHLHRLWLDVTRAVGPHVHHRDVVHAALTHMEEQLNGPNRDATLNEIKEMVRPAAELAAVIRQRDFARLRDMVRNRPPSDLANVLTDLSLEEQVLFFRTLPRKTAAATFEYLSGEAQESLLKAMASEDAAALLNDMAPDDRTKFLEELPASATRQLLALLTPEERAVAVTLLGYPEGSIGRLMTPNYTSVREDWTIQDVLDYIRTHGQNSETLNVIYVVDDRGVLIDDIRIRDFLLTAPTNTVRDLMDRRFVALKATDDQEAAVTVFRTGGSLGAPGHRLGRRAHRHRHRGRRARRRGSGGDRRHPARGRIRSPRRAVHADRVSPDDPETRGLADGALHRRNADGDRHGRVRARNRESGRAGALRAAHHFERRQLRLAGVHARHPGAGARRSEADRLVEGDAARDRRGARARRHSRHDRIPAHRDLVRVLHDLRRALAARGADGLDLARRGRALGHADGIAPAVSAPAARLRSRGFVRAVCGDARGRHRTHHLFQRRHRHPARDVALEATACLGGAFGLG